MFLFHFLFLLTDISVFYQIIWQHSSRLLCLTVSSSSTCWRWSSFETAQKEYEISGLQFLESSPPAFRVGLINILRSLAAIISAPYGRQLISHLIKNHFWCVACFALASSKKCQKIELLYFFLKPTITVLDINLQRWRRKQENKVGRWIYCHTGFFRFSNTWLELFHLLFRLSIYSIKCSFLKQTA